MFFWRGEGVFYTNHPRPPPLPPSPLFFSYYIIFEGCIFCVNLEFMWFFCWFLTPFLFFWLFSFFEKIVYAPLIFMVLSKFYRFCKYTVIFLKCSPQSAHSAKNFNISVTELWVRGTPKFSEVLKIWGTRPKCISSWKRLSSQILTPSTSQNHPH